MSFCEVQYFGNHFFLSNSISSMMESEINGKLNPRKLASSSAFPPERKNIRHWFYIFSYFCIFFSSKILWSYITSFPIFEIFFILVYCFTDLYLLIQVSVNGFMWITYTRYTWGHSSQQIFLIQCQLYPCIIYYRPQGKVMFSEACVNHSVHGEGEGGLSEGQRSPPRTDI